MSFRSHATARLIGCRAFFSGSHEPLTLALADEVRAQSANPLSTIIGNEIRTSPAYAALVNGSAAGALDVADSNRAMSGHTTPAVVATALTLAEELNATSLEFLTAIIVGIETECRIGFMIDPSRTGSHPTGTQAPFNAAAACTVRAERNRMAVRLQH
jgi:2-methylcitrate dehydratase PrpD